MFRSSQKATGPRAQSKRTPCRLGLQRCFLPALSTACLSEACDSEGNEKETTRLGLQPFREAVERGCSSRSTNQFRTVGGIRPSYRVLSPYSPRPRNCHPHRSFILFSPSLQKRAGWIDSMLRFVPDEERESGTLLLPKCNP